MHACVCYTVRHSDFANLIVFSQSSACKLVSLHCKLAVQWEVLTDGSLKNPTEWLPMGSGGSIKWLIYCFDHRTPLLKCNRIVCHKL